MKVKNILSLLFISLSLVSFSQEESKSISKIIDGVLPQIALVEIDTLQKRKFVDYLSFIKEIESSKNIKGSIEFGFNGSEVENSNLYNISTGMKASYGIYPLEIEAQTSIQTQVINGEFQENLSTLDISMDYHPFNNLEHETYVFVMRSKNKFLGIDQRYEIGGGYIFNFYSAKYDNGKSKSILKKGKSKLDKLYYWEKKYDTVAIKKLKDTIVNYAKSKNYKINKNDFDDLFEIKEEHENIIRRLYSKHRVALLLGFNYEIEKTQTNLPLFNSAISDTIVKQFEATNLFRFAIAPKYELQGDKFKWKNTVFFKFGLLDLVDDVIIPDATISNQLISDKKLDYWIDLRTSLEFKISKRLSVITSLNYIYDNAPKRIYIENTPGNILIASAEQKFTNIDFKLKFNF